MWGDVVENCSILPCAPPDGVVNITTDVTAILDKFRNLERSPSKARSDLEPLLLDQLINISDVTFSLDAFRGDEYPFAIPTPCPVPARSE